MLVCIPSHLTIAGSTQDVFSICGMLSVYLIARTWLCDLFYVHVKRFKKAYDMPMSFGLHKQLTNTKL